jgi:hypothetical protein
MELVGLWHEESIQIGRFIMDRARQQGWNLVIDGTLANIDLAHQRIDALRNAGYQSITVADVEVSRSEALQRIRDRYVRESRSEPLGGRVVPVAVINNHFSAPGGMSWSLFNSNELYALGKANVELVAFRQGNLPGTHRVTFDTLSGDSGRVYIPKRPQGADVWVSSHMRNGVFIHEYWRSAPSLS